MSENKPYKCTKCGYKHAKGKVYEDHKQFAEGGVIPDSSTKLVVTKDDVVKFMEVTKGGSLEAVATRTVKGVEQNKHVKIDAESKGGFWDVKALDMFLIRASKKQLKLLLGGTKVCGVKGGSDAMYIANWKASCWENDKDHGRIPFSVDEMIKYRPMIDMANGKHVGMLAKSRSGKALREATKPRDG